MIFWFIIIVIINSTITTFTELKTEVIFLTLIVHLLQKLTITFRIFKKQYASLKNYFNHDFTF